MHTLEMTDAEWYQRILDVLLEHLGPVELQRFLAYAKAGRGELAAACQPWVTQIEAETIQRGMQAYHPRHAAVPALADAPAHCTPKPRHAMTDDELHWFGLKLIGEKRGLPGLIDFVRLGSPGAGDYTRDRHKWLDKLDLGTVLAQIRQLQEERYGGGIGNAQAAGTESFCNGIRGASSEEPVSLA